MAKPNRMDIFDMSDFPMSLVRRSIFAGTGYDMDELAGKPLIGVACSSTEINPGHMHLGLLAQRVKEGVHAAGGAPFEFNVPAPCDGIAMGHLGMRFILAQRDLIADMLETHCRSMRFDGLVLIASCDKIIPGMIMAAARLDLPALMITGGPNAMAIRMLPGFKGSISHNDYADADDKFAAATCATCGACEEMGTANTFQCLAEALGLALPGSSTLPAYGADKLRAARRAGMRIVQMVESGPTARQVLTREALYNALMVDLAIGGSTNAALHLPAIGAQINVDLPLSEFNAYAARIPTLCSIAPNGPHGIQDLNAAGGVPAVMKVLQPHLHLNVLNVAGQTIEQMLSSAAVRDPRVIRPLDQPYLAEGGTVALFGNLAPDGAVIKQSAVAADMRVFSGPAKVFESEADCLAAIREQQLQEGQVLVIRYEGPQGAPGMPEMLAVTLALELWGFHRVALVTDGRFSGATAGPCVGHVSPEAYAGGALGLVRDGDEIAIDIPKRKLELRVSEAELATRRAQFKPVEREVPPGYMRRYRRLVGSAAKGALLE